MGFKTAYLAQKVLGQSFGGNTYTWPLTYYIAISDLPFDQTVTTISAISELAGTGGYARVAVVNDSTKWSTSTLASPSVVTNSDDIVWATASADWASTPASIYICDASTAGHPLYGTDIANAVPILSGDTFKILAETLTLLEL
jgi:hypothetical protein